MTHPADDDREPELEGDSPRAASDLWPSEQLLSDAVGRLMEFWGFKRHMGRIWALLYLSDEPLGANELRDKLQLSAGSVSMSLTELLRWGVVKKVWIHGQRRDFFVAEGNLWKMISRVFRERSSSTIRSGATPHARSCSASCRASEKRASAGS